MGRVATEQRGVVDERRLVLPPFDRESLATASLVDVAAGGTLEYFIAFDGPAGTTVEAEARTSPFVIVAMDGQLRVTDGTNPERILPANDPGREVSVPTPIEWKTVPAGARIIPKR